MFHNIPQQIREQMRYLEDIDRRDRKDSTPAEKRLRQIPPETGMFLTLIASMAPEGQFLEIGTSAGYSTLWLTLACHNPKRHITTFEILPEKAHMAERTFTKAGVTNVVTLIQGNALDFLSKYTDVAFVFLDAEKIVYQQCYDIIIPRIVRGGILLADNAISHKDILRPMLDKAVSDERIDAVVVPIGNGVLFCRKM